MGRIRNVTRLKTTVHIPATNPDRHFDDIVGWIVELEENKDWNLVARKRTETGPAIAFVRAQQFDGRWMAQQNVTAATFEGGPVTASFNATNEDQFFYSVVEVSPGVWVPANGDHSSIRLSENNPPQDGSIPGDNYLDMYWAEPGQTLTLVPKHVF